MHYFDRSRLTLMLTLLTLALAGHYAIKASEEDRSAFVRWRSQVEALLSGEDVYARFDYPNPPIMGLILYPFTCLPRVDLDGFQFDLGALAWFTVKVILGGVAVHWTLRLVAPPNLSTSTSWFVAGLTGLLSLRPMLGDLYHGNVNLFLLYLVVGMLAAYRANRDLLAGLLLGLAIACKVTPALFLFYFAWKRAWRTLLGALLGLALFLVVVPGLCLGFEWNAHLLISWYQLRIVPYTFDGVVFTRQTNQSLPALVYRMLTVSPAFYDSSEQPTGYFHLVDWPPETARRIVQMFAAIYLVLMVGCCRVPAKRRSGVTAGLEWSFVVLGMLLFSERTWKHHCVFLLLPYAALSAAWIEARSRWTSWLIPGSLAFSALLIASTSTTLWQPVGFTQGAKLAQVYGAYVWANLLLLGTAVLLLSRAAWRGIGFQPVEIAVK
jgi:hypothetical protein